MGDFYDEFFGKENTLEYAREYANEVHDYKNSSRQVDNLLYKLRKEINTGDENKPSLMMRNFNLYMELQYDQAKHRLLKRQHKELKEKVKSLEREKEQLESLQKK